MDIDLLQAFCQLAKSENYRIGADQLFITQSALTKKIKRLEESLEVTLFERGRQGAKLTQAGKTLLPEAISTVNKFADFKRLSNCVSEGSTGHLNISFGISTYLIAPKCISLFKASYPEVHITLNDMPASVQEEKLLSGELHLGFTRLDNLNPSLKSIKLLTDHLSIAIHEDEDFDTKALFPSLSKLNYMQLNPKRGAKLHRQINQYLARENQNLVATQEADDILTLLALVSSRLGYTIVPSSAKEICQPNIRLIPLNGENAKWDIGLVWNDAREDIVRKKFVGHVLSSMAIAAE